MEEIIKTIKEFCPSDNDSCTRTVKKELLLYIDEYKNLFNNDLTMKNDAPDEILICMSGDNLVTYKQMLNRTWKNIDTDTQNDRLFSSFFFIPYIVNDATGRLNSKRATISEYSDNPFCFFTAIKDMYYSSFSKEEGEKDKVKKILYRTKKFWELFGTGEDGYRKYMKSFCLESIYVLERNEKFSKFFIIGNTYTDEDWPIYKELMENFKLARMEAVYKRILDYNQKHISALI